MQTADRGIFLITWGKWEYGVMAHNLTMSIKALDPFLPVHILCDHSSVSRNPDLSIFDRVEFMEGEVDDPAWLKINMYGKLPFTHTLYLDVDAIAIGSLTPLLDDLIRSDKPYRCFVYDWYDQNSPKAMPLMRWAFRDTIWEKYGFTDHKLPATQS